MDDESLSWADRWETLVVAKAILEQVGLAVGIAKESTVSNGRLVVEPTSRLQFDIAELVSRSGSALQPTDEERAWMDDPPIGNEFW